MRLNNYMHASIRVISVLTCTEHRYYGFMYLTIRKLIAGFY